jgi:hypothetical protein
MTCRRALERALLDLSNLREVVNIAAIRVVAALEPDRHGQPSRDAEAKVYRHATTSKAERGDAAGSAQSVADPCQELAAEGAPATEEGLRPAVTDKATGQVQGGAYDPRSASAPQPSTGPELGELAGFACTCGAAWDVGAEYRLGCQVHDPAAVENRRRAEFVARLCGALNSDRTTCRLYRGHDGCHFDGIGYWSIAVSSGYETGKEASMRASGEKPCSVPGRGVDAESCPDDQIRHEKHVDAAGGGPAVGGSGSPGGAEMQGLDPGASCDRPFSLVRVYQRTQFEVREPDRLVATCERFEDADRLSDALNGCAIVELEIVALRKVARAARGYLEEPGSAELDTLGKATAEWLRGWA